MDDMKAMMQNELGQALAGLIPLPAVETTTVTNIVQTAPTILPAIILPTIALAPAIVASPIDIEAQTKNPRKRNSPLNTCVGGLRLEGCMLYPTCIFDLILTTCCIARASCIHALHIVHASY